MSDSYRKGIYLAFATSIISGVSVFLNKFAVASIKPPLFFTSIKNVAVGLIILAVIILSRRWVLLHTLKRKDIVRLTAIALVGGSVPFSLYFTGLAQTQAINAAIIHKSLVIWVALLAVPYLKERVSILGILSVIVLFVGNIVVGGFTGFTFSWGELAILVATLLWAVENVIAKRVLSHIHPDIVVAARMGAGALILLTVSIATNPGAFSQMASLDRVQWAWLGITALLLTGYVMTWYRALALAPAVTVTSVLVSSTIITNVLSAVFITHSFTPDALLQTAILTCGILLAYLAYRETARIPAPPVSGAEGAHPM